MSKRLWVFIAFALMMQVALSQPSEYSLFRSAASWLNPALTGTGLETWKLSGLMQSRSVNDTLSHSNQLWAVEYRFDFSRVKKSYGLVIERRHPMSLSLGFFSERRTSDYHWYPYHRLGLALNAQVFSESGLHLLALSVRPVYYTAAAYIPVSSISLSPFTDSILPGHPPERFFTADAGVVLGFYKMDCWADDQAYRWELGMSVHNVTLEQQTQRPDVHPGREYLFHAGSLIELNKAWGCVAKGMYMHYGESFYQGGINLIYRRHMSLSDRWRVGMAYRSSRHLTLSGGFRIYGTSRHTLSADLELSHDFPLKEKNTLWPWHRQAWEISLIIKPIKKCWGLDNCSGDYQFETY
ncbi:MAG: hypothetical protein HPY80_01135 [Bacteroidales bacterium]|nr:hypothetical protein [Bacteroidales bacterium]